MSRSTATSIAGSRPNDVNSQYPSRLSSRSQKMPLSMHGSSEAVGTVTPQRRITWSGSPHAAVDCASVCRFSSSPYRVGQTHDHGGAVGVVRLRRPASSATIGVHPASSSTLASASGGQRAGFISSQATVGA